MRLFRAGVCVGLAAMVQVVCASAARADAPPVAQPTPHDAYPPLRLQPPGTVPGQGFGPVVRLRANHPRARLQIMQLKWRDVCSVPCGGQADPNGMYRVGGGTLRPSAPFRLPRPSGEVLIDAEMGSNVKHWVGVGLTIGGGVSAIIGSLFAWAGQAVDTSSANDEDVRTFFNIYAVTYLIIGGVLLAVGLPLWLTNNSSVHVQ